jgi:hypothetical protein
MQRSKSASCGLRRPGKRARATRRTFVAAKNRKNGFKRWENRGKTVAITVGNGNKPWRPHRALFSREFPSPIAGEFKRLNFQRTMLRSGE